LETPTPSSTFPSSYTRIAAQFPIPLKLTFLIMTSISNAVIPKGDIILVTGVTGYIGSHVADQALAAGYKVRGAVRNSVKAQWLQELFDKKYGHGKFESIVLKDILDEDALAVAVRGVAGIAHIANDSNLSSSPQPYIPNAINGALSVLRNAAKEPKIKSVVLTSSSMAAAGSKPNVDFDITLDSYNEDAIKLAWDDTFEDPAKAFIVYAAAKAESEKAAWKWIEENKPGFVFNTVLPAANFGPALSPEHQGLPSTGGWPKMVFDGSFDDIMGVPPRKFQHPRSTTFLVLTYSVTRVLR
jgi:nucleoside-diphosphate-sugar epimerase